MSRQLHNRNYYVKTKDRYRDARAASRERMKAAARELIRQAKSVPCADCGQKFPYYVMDFDHLTDKSMNVSKMVTYSLTRIRDEIAKCDVVCANCHRERTFLRGSVTQR